MKTKEKSIQKGMDALFVVEYYSVLLFVKFEGKYMLNLTKKSFILMPHT